MISIMPLGLAVCGTGGAIAVGLSSTGIIMVTGINLEYLGF